VARRLPVGGDTADPTMDNTATFLDCAMLAGVWLERRTVLLEMGRGPGEVARILGVSPAAVS